MIVSRDVHAAAGTGAASTTEGSKRRHKSVIAKTGNAVKLIEGWDRCDADKESRVSSGHDD